MAAEARLCVAEELGREALNEIKDNLEPALEGLKKQVEELRGQVKVRSAASHYHATHALLLAEP